MSALDTTGTGQPGQSTRDGGRPSAGDATRTLTLSQAPYADAVHQALTAAGVEPDVVEAGCRKPRSTHPELFVRLVWLPGHPALAPGYEDEQGPRGLTLAWSHVTGWSAWSGTEHVLLDVDALAAPELIADAARHFTQHPPVTGAPWVPPADGRWEYALELDIALVAFEDREVTP